VNDVNLAPEISPIENIVANEGDIVKIMPGVIDPDGDNVKLGISEPVGGDGVWGTHYAAAGEYTVTITASDGIDESSIEVNIVVNNVDRAPVIEEMEIFRVAENEEVVIKPKVSDADEDAVELTVVEDLPGNASFEDGVFKWTPGYEVSSGETEEFTVSFTANDGELSSSQEAVIIVYNTNRKPVVLNATKSHATAYAGESVLFVVDAEDADGDELSYTWKLGWLTSVQGTNKMQRTFTEPGKKKFKVMVSDGKEEVAQIFTVNIVEKPQPAPQPEPKQVVQVVQPAPQPEPEPEIVVSGPAPTKTYYI